MDFTESSPVSFNRYAYANNSPYNYTDPNGESPLDIAFLAYDIGRLGVALFQGDGVKAAAIDVGLSVAGVISPIPGAGVALKAKRAQKAAQEAGKGVAKTGERVATGFKGSKGFELKNAPYQKARNKPASIDGREFSGHALDQMQNRGVMPSVVDNAIRTGEAFSTRAGTAEFYGTANKVRTITSSETGRVVTVIMGAPK